MCCCNHTCYGMVSVTSASRYHSRYQSRSSAYIRGLIQRNFAELAEAVPIVTLSCHVKCYVASKRIQKVLGALCFKRWQTMIPRDRFFYPNLTRIMESFSCSHLFFFFLLLLFKISFQKPLNTLRCNFT